MPARFLSGFGKSQKRGYFRVDYDGPHSRGLQDSLRAKPNSFCPGLLREVVGSATGHAGSLRDFGLRTSGDGAKVLCRHVQGEWTAQSRSDSVSTSTRWLGGFALAGASGTNEDSGASQCCRSHRKRNNPGQIISLLGQPSWWRAGSCSAGSPG